jgi:hypothetical protein
VKKKGLKRTLQWIDEKKNLTQQEKKKKTQSQVVFK